MADPALKITEDYVKCFLALMGKGIWWPEEILLSLRQQGLDTLDVVHIMSHGAVTIAEKDTAHGTTFTMVGATCDDVNVEVVFWADPNQLELRVLSVNCI